MQDVRSTIINHASYLLPRPSIMTLTLAIPFYNQLDTVKGIMGLLKAVTSPSVEWLIIDNGSTDPVEDFFRSTLRPKRLQYEKNHENVGMVKTYNQIFNLVKTDLVAILHNDVYVYEPGWDKRVIHVFNNIDKLGSVGFFGSAGCGLIGERLQDTEYPGQMAGLSNLLEAEQHGIRLAQDFLPAAILDGFAMIFNMDMIKAAGGLDPHYQYHHLYDRDLPLTALSLGYKNIILNIPCHHYSGTTANRTEYQTWIDQTLKRSNADKYTHDANTVYFKKKWAHALPLYIEPDFTFRKGRFYQYELKGDAILRSNSKHEIRSTK